ncbi:MULTISPECIES: YafY family protein [unclassified Oceanispirochaeta]|uniref:helix-turn-helix transcriptional regulator n=1 Tax=unclassified Oceanispirochaeta TaxID=2635722 RepID=UPI000E098842|nr:MULTISPECIES: WYL domain-containing protein [unclassified Oceanispirochaeta]MBF9018480.1 WYL domain-containing protein [Oceanispirochaeta sp. M2]NPD74886.1 WYL domain-containing protein [Oceanispirochaeta sp. M1]RDG29274.1 WYL domain-containing protein [Oceanispirochaeta sp. M1]
MGKHQLERILEIDRIIRDRGSCTKQEMVERFEVSEKSVERDFSYMRDSLLAPLEYNRFNDQYIYTNKNYFLPAVSLSEGEALALTLSSEILNHFNAVGEFDQLRESFNRLTAYLPDAVKVDLSRINNRVSVITEQQTLLAPDVWSTLMECVRANRQVRVQYRKPDNKSSEEKVLEPYYLTAYRGSWYIIANSPTTSQIRTYALSRMKKPSKMKESFTIPGDFKLDDYIDPEWGIYSRKEKYDFTLKFSPHAACIIREKRWHREQKTEELEDGSLILSFPSGQLESIGQWVMGWGSDVHVITPPELIEKIRKTVGELGEMYQE